MILNRRRFLRQAGAGIGAAALASVSHLPAAEKERSRMAAAQAAPPSGHGLPAGWRKMRKLDAHNHVFGPVHRPDASWTEVESLVAAAEVLGIDRLYCSRPIVGGAMADIEVVRDANDSILAAMKRFPERIAGYCFVQPGNGRAALDEIDRCLDAGMIGIKLYNQFKYTDPVVYPVAEKCIARGIPFLGHSAFLTDPRSLAAQPKTSHALDFCALSRRYPELMLILGHVNGGGDWEWAIKGLRECDNVFLDTSGSVLEADTIERCVQELGAARVLFATDSTVEGCVGKVLSAAITPAQREDIFWRNFQRILDRRRA
jgi:uncharacterized protein